MPINSYQRKMYKSNLKHGLEWKKHKYLYKDENGNYVYPEDLRKNLDGNAKTKVGQRLNVAVNKKKAELRSIGRGENYGMYPGSPITSLQSDKNSRRQYADLRNEESKKWERGEYFDKDDKEREDRDRKTAKNISVGAEAKARKAEADYNRAVKDRENYENASGFERDLGKALIKSEKKKAEKKDKKYKKEHAAELAGRAEKEKADDDRYKKYIAEKKNEYMKKMAEATEEMKRKKRKESPDSEDASKVSGKALGSFIVSSPLDKFRKKKKSVKHSDELKSNTMNLWQREMYKSHLEHGAKGQRAAHHKYLYIDANGRYVYPEDVAGKAKSAVSNAGERASNFITDQKQKIKDKKFIRESNKLKKHDIADEYDSYEEWLKNVQKHNAATDKGKQNQQINSAHNKSTINVGSHLISYQKGDHGTTKELDKQKEKTVKRNRSYNEKAKDAGFQAEQERRQATIDARNTRDRDSSEYANLAKAERDTAERKKAKVASKKKVDDQRKSAHAGYEADKKAFPEGGSTEELERQKIKTKAKKSASNRFNELDKSTKKHSSSMDWNVRKQHQQINSAHQMSTDIRKDPLQFDRADRVDPEELRKSRNAKKWDYRNLYSVNYYDQSGSIERNKRKTALRKRHKK